LTRLIDVTVHLAKQELPFRGHNETQDSSNRGNYIETLNLLAKHDTVLDAHLKNPKVFTGKYFDNYLFNILMS
jgi:hypothetical protein